MFENKKFDLRISQELLNQCKNVTNNLSLFIREAIRTKLETCKKKKHFVSLVEIRARTAYIYFAKLLKVIDGDTFLLEIDLGFFTKITEKVRLIGVDTKPTTTKIGKRAFDFVTKELTNSYLLIEVHKKEKFGRYLAYIYYHKEYKNFENIIRYGKLLNDELLNNKLAKRYR